MPHLDKHAPGSLSWIELATSDQAAAKAFYSSLFGWQAVDFPMGPEQTYTVFQLEGRDAAAAFTIHGPLKEMGVPPHWGLYMATDSADASAEKVKKAGGRVLNPPIDVFDLGRMAAFMDPAGATFAVWQAGRNPGIGIAGVPGTLCWADLNTPDQAAGAAFYKAVFGWEATPGEDNSGYLHIKNGDQFIGGIPAAHQLPPHAPPHWLSYFQVVDCDASVAKAKEMGAMICMPPMTLERVGRFAVVADPQGAAFSVFQPLAS